MLIIKDKKLEEMISKSHNYVFPMNSYDNRDEIKDICRKYKEDLFSYIKELHQKKKWWEKFLPKKKTSQKIFKKVEAKLVNPLKSREETEKFLHRVKMYGNPFVTNIPHMHISAIDTCNMNCKGCGALAPLYNKCGEKNELMPEVLDNLLKRYNQLSSYAPIYNFDIVGGEPLLNRYIAELMTVARKNLPNSGIAVITNGLLMDKMSDDFFKVAQDNQIKLSLSVYGRDTYFEKLNLSDDPNVECHECSNCTGHSAVVFPNYMKVKIGSVPICANGDIFYCGFSAVRKFNEYFGTNYELIKGKDFLNIYEVNDYQEILKMMQQPNCNFHKYCKDRETFKWGISKFDRYEWEKC